MPGKPFLSTVARILAAGITVITAPIATSELISASFAAALPRTLAFKIEVNRAKLRK